MNSRISVIQKSLSEDEALLVENPIDLFYLTKQTFSAGSLLIKKEKVALFLDGRYQSVGEKIGFPLFNRTDDLLKQELSTLQTLQIDSHFTSWERGKKLESLLGNKNLLAKPSLLIEWRKKKDAEEMAFMREAAKITDCGFDFIKSILKEGISEREVAARLEIYFLQKHKAHSAFDPIIAFGENSANPHARPSERTLKPEDIILLDFGAKIHNYCSDMTRTFFFKEPSSQLSSLLETVKEAQSMAIARLKPGVDPSSLDEEVRAFFKERGYEGGVKHSLGHGIGLEVHEAPILRINTPSFLLEEGMCVTIEPGLYLPDVGGARIEDTVEITKEGAVLLTKSLYYV